MKFIIDIYNNDKFERELAFKGKFGAAHSRITVKYYDTETSSVRSINVRDLIDKYYEIHHYDDRTGCHLHYFKQLGECDVVGLIVYETGFICYVCSEVLKKHVVDKFKVKKFSRVHDYVDGAINLEWLDTNYEVSNWGHLSTVLIKSFSHYKDLIIERPDEYILPVYVGDNYYLAHFEKGADLARLSTKLCVLCKNDYELDVMKGLIL